MLEERWRETVARHGTKVAVRELGSGRSVTFAELAAKADASDAPPGPVVFPTGRDFDFLVAVLRAWRAGRTLCPLETAQREPVFPVAPPAGLHLKLTSGMSGAPKCVAFTGAQLAADAKAIVTGMGLHPGSPNLGVISLAHSYGFSSLVLPLLLHGIPLYLVPSALPAALDQAERSCRGEPLVLPAVPALWAAWAEAGVIPASVRLAISAGAPLPLVVEEKVFTRFGLKVHNFLGASECGGIAYDAGGAPRNQGADVGRALPNVIAAVGADGCLEVRGPAVGTGYWPESGERLREGVYRSQDLVEIDETGLIRILGREGDVINVAGRKLRPEVVEEALLRHPQVRAALVLGLPTAGWHGDVVTAVVETRDGIREQILRGFLLELLPAWQVPRNWHFVASLGVDARGKRSRAAWRRKLSQESSSD